MEFFNTNADESKYAQALQEYSNSLAQGKDKQAEEDAKVDDYNSKLQSVLEPIGAKLVEEPLQNLIKGTVKGIAKSSKERRRSSKIWSSKSSRQIGSETRRLSKT